MEPTQIGKTISLCLYHLAEKNDNLNIMCGTGVYHTDGMAPLLEEKNNNVFHRSFGIDFDLRLSEDEHAIPNEGTHCAIRPISPFEYYQMVHLVDGLGIKVA